MALTPKEEDSLIVRALNTEEGRLELAKSLAEIFRHDLNRQSSLHGTRTEGDSCDNGHEPPSPA